MGNGMDQEKIPRYEWSIELPDASMDDVEQTAKAELKGKGFGVVFELDLQEKIKEKLLTDIRPYKILGACSPPHAYNVIQAEENIGCLLPCNVLLQQMENKAIRVSFKNPLLFEKIVRNDKVTLIAITIAEQLQQLSKALIEKYKGTTLKQLSMIKEEPKKQIPYCWSIEVKNQAVEDVHKVVSENMKKFGFGQVTFVDVQKTLKKKLDKDIQPYQIVGYCKPPHALNAIKVEDNVGSVLPCQVLLQGTGEEHENVRISIQAPMVTEKLIGNDKITEIAIEVDKDFQQLTKDIQAHYNS